MKVVRILLAIVAIVLMINGVNTIYKSFNHESVTETNNVNFSVSKIVDATSIGDLTTDNNFIIMTVKIDNQGDEVYDVNALRFKLLVDDKEYEYYADAVLSMENAMYMDTINPGLSKEYDIVYETPFLHAEKKCQLKILDSAFSNKNVIIDCE